MPDTRPSPERYHDYAHRYGSLHDRIVNNETADDTYLSKISNRKKLEYICQANYIPHISFNVDMPLPLEDWRVSHDVSKVTSGLYFSDLRRQFYVDLLAREPDLRLTPAWIRLGEAEFWTHAFNFLLRKKTSGVLIEDERVLH